MGARNSLDTRGGGMPAVVDKTLGTAFETIQSLATKLPVIEYLEKNIDGFVSDIHNALDATLTAEQTAIAKAAEALVSQLAAKASEDAAKVSELAAAQSAADLAAAVAAAQLSEANAAQSEAASATSAADAVTSQAAAQLSETHAATSETNASAKAAAALASQNAAALSETNAAASRDAAAVSKVAADADAAAAHADRLQADADVAAADASKTAAATSEANALTYKNAANTSATNAATSEANALAYKNAAGVSAGNASTSEGNALTYKNAAGTSAGNASASETSALTYKNAASTSAANAATSETNANASKNAAATSATNAATSEGNALTYKNAASTSATAAATSEANAAATLANALVKGNNLADVADKPTARTNLGVQPSADPTFTGNVGVPTRTAGDSTANAASTAFVAAAIAPFTGKNRIINGMGLVNQRTNTALGVNVSGYGGPDRWQAGASGSGAAITQTQGSMVINGVNYACINQTAATAGTTFTGANYVLGIAQPIEGLNCYDLMGQQATVSFWFQAAVAGSYSVAVKGYTTAISNVTQFTYNTANTPQRVVITLPALPATLAIPFSAAGGLYLYIGACNQGTLTSASGHSNAWQAGSFFSSPADVMWANTAGKYIAATMIQLEAGSQATPYEWLDSGRVLEQCLRYCWVLAGAGLYLAAGSTTSVNTQLNCPVPMRATPTVTHNLLNTSYVSTSPVGIQWGLVSAGIAYATVGAGTITISVASSAYNLCINVFGMTLSIVPNELSTGAGVLIQATAEL